MSALETSSGQAAEASSTPVESLSLHQANERTMLAWIRTGIALMAFGFAIARFGLFLRELAAVGAVRTKPLQSLGTAWMGTLLVAMGMVTNLAAVIRYARLRQAIQRGEVGAPSPAVVYALGMAAALIGLVMTVLLLHGVAD